MYKTFVQASLLKYFFPASSILVHMFKKLAGDYAYFYVVHLKL